MATGTAHRCAARGEVAYWQEELAGVQPLELPCARTRPERQTFDGAGYGFDVDRGLLDRLTGIGRAHGATAHMVLLAAYQLVLARFSGQRDFAVGSPVAGRPEPELEGLVGMFVNVLAFRARLDGDPTFTELVARTRETCLEAYAHQELPFAQLVSELKVERDVSRSPVFQAVLAIQNYAVRGDGADEPAGLDVEAFGLRAAGTRFDIELFLMEWPDGLHGAFNYNTDLFDEADVARMGDCLGRLLEAAADRPDVPLSTLDTLAPDERERVVVEWNDTARAFPDDATLPGLFAAQTAATPDAVAVDFEGATLTYAELDLAAARVARRLHAEGVGPGSLVAVSAERSPELVAALLGVLRTGAGYTPLDPEYPAGRLASMLADSGAGVLLTQARLPVPEECAARVLLLDESGSWPGEGPLPAGPAADDTAYMIYTSGSTGRPKGCSTPTVPSSTGCCGCAAPTEWVRTTRCCTRPRPASTSRCGSCSCRCSAGPVWSSPGRAVTRTPPTCGTPSPPGASPSPTSCPRCSTCSSPRTASSAAPGCARSCAAVRNSRRAPRGSSPRDCRTAGSRTCTARPRPPSTSAAGSARARWRPCRSARPSTTPGCTSWTRTCAPLPSAPRASCTSAAYRSRSATTADPG